VFELRASEKEPVSSLITFSISCHLTLDCVENRDWLLRFLLLLQLLVFLNNSITLLELALVGLNLVYWERNFAEAIKEGNQVFCCQFVLSKAKEFERSVLLKDTLEFLNDSSAKVVVGKVEHLQVPVHSKACIGLKSQHDMLQVNILEATGSQEDNLEFLALRDELSKQTDLFGLILLGRWLDLVRLVSTNRD